MDRALEIHEKREVFSKVKKMSLRAFKEFAKGEQSKKQLSKIKVVGNKVYVGKTLAVTISKELDTRTRNYLTDIIVKAGEALQTGDVLYTTQLYDMEKLRRFERGADRLIKS